MTDPNNSVQAALLTFFRQYAATCTDCMGDLETMLAGLWFRIHAEGNLLDPHYPPPGYRSEKLRAYLRRECGALRTTQWGATALRGRMKPETKGHIIHFLELVNQLPVALLPETLYACGMLYAANVNQGAVALLLPAASTVQQQIQAAVHITGTVGRVQQGLVYAMLLLEARLQHPHLTVQTKRTYAGDQQSGIQGDISLLVRQQLLSAYEVKGLVLTQTQLDKVLAGHGNHPYSLYILALGFRPASLQDEINSLQNTFAIHLFDFLLTKLAGLQVVSGRAAEQLLRDWIDIYNADFCEAVEGDPAIRLYLE